MRAESKFYATIKKGLAPLGFTFYRVENKLELSLPDAFFHGAGVSGWAEFKVAKERARGWAIDWNGRTKQLMTMRQLSQAGVPVIIIAQCGGAVAISTDVYQSAKLGEVMAAPFFNKGRFAAMAEYIRSISRRK